VVFLLNAFRIRRNRRLHRFANGSSRLRAACDHWLRLFDSRPSCSKEIRRASFRIESTCQTLFGRHMYSLNRPLGYLTPSCQTVSSSLKTLLFTWINRRTTLFFVPRHGHCPINPLCQPKPKDINILVWNVGANINLPPQHTILVEALKAHRVNIACLQEFRNRDILLPMHTLRKISEWPSLITRIGTNQAPHVFGGSLVASNLGYLIRDDTSLCGSIEFNSVRVTGHFHVVNVYLPYMHTEMRRSDGYDDAPFLSHIDTLSLQSCSSILIVGDFNVNLRYFPNESLRGHTLQKLLDSGFEILNPVDVSGLFLDTHYSASSRKGSCIDVVLWKGPLGPRHSVRNIRVKRLCLNSRDHFGLLVSVNGVFPRRKRWTVPSSVFAAFAKCIASAPITSSPDAPLSQREMICKKAQDLWASSQQGTTPLSEAHISDLVASWHKFNSRESNPFFPRYFSVCSSLIQARESFRKISSPRLLCRCLLSISSLARQQRALRLDITRHHNRERQSHSTRAAILSGKDSDIRRFLLQVMNPPGNMLDLSTLSEEDFARFRTFYQECWDPPDAAPLDLSFLEPDATPVQNIPSAVAHDISEPCSETELALALKFLRRGKAPGPSRLPVDFYKEALSLPEVSAFLLQQVNDCLAGKRPPSQDECKLVLIFKKGSRSDPSNWRPINLTNAAFRVCEAVIYRRLIAWSEQVLSENAFGFRPGRRAEDVGYLLAHNLHRSDRTRRPTHLLSLDISKAFDTVPHDLLLRSLSAAGLSSASVKIIASMLLGHKCIVGDSSSPRHFVVFIKRGVLQGGILSPLLFNIFFDQSISTAVPGVLPLSYADDVSALHLGPVSSEPSALSIRHHESIFQQRTAARALSAGSIVADVSTDAGPLPSSLSHPLSLVDSDSPPSSLFFRDLVCRDQVNAWLCERDEWLLSHFMRHNATKSESHVLHCSSVGVPPITLPSGAIPVRAHVTVLGLQPHPSGFCVRPGARASGVHAAQLFVKAWQKLRLYVTLQELRSLLMAFVYSHSVFGSCLQRFTSVCQVAPMTRCIRSALLAHPTVNSISLYEFMGLMLPSMRVIYLRLRYLIRCLDPTSPQLIRDEFTAHRKRSPWFLACLRSLSSLPQPKSGLSLGDRLESCIVALASPDAELLDTFLTPPPDDHHAILVTDGSVVIDEHSCAGPAGWGYILFFNGLTYRACGPLGSSTSDNAEAMAIFHGLLHCSRLNAPFIHVRTDNQSCKDFLEGIAFPENLGCLRLYLALPSISSQIFSYKVYSHSAPPHRDILNDIADELASLGRQGQNLSSVSDISPEHLAFLNLPIPRFNPGREGESPPVHSPETTHSYFLRTFRLAVSTSIAASQVLKHLDAVRCNFRWINFTGTPPATVHAKIMKQQYLYHLRYDLHAHFKRYTTLTRLCTPCPLCGSDDNSSVHRIFECHTNSSSLSTRDVISFTQYRRALCAYRACYTSLLPLDDNGCEFPRSDADYLFWLSCPRMLISDPVASVRALTDSEMQTLSDASNGFHLLYVKYSVMASPPSDAPIQSASSRPSRAPNARSPTESDVAVICSRLRQCRLYDELISWYRWHGYSYSTTNSIMHRALYDGHLPMSLLGLLMKAEVLLSVCLCAYPSVRRSLFQSHTKSRALRITSTIYNLLRAGNHLNVPISDHTAVAERPVSRHIDAPDFFYELPFHYFNLNSSPLAEAWFAAETVADRRNLIEWPKFADSNGTIPCPFWKLIEFDEIPKALYDRPGKGYLKGVRSSLHPQIQLIYDVLKHAILRGHIRVTWRVRFRTLLDAHPPDSQRASIIRRQLILSLILGDVRDCPGYKPRDAVFDYSYDFTSTVQDVLCIPICHQNISVRHVPGFSLPVRGPRPHPPRRSFYLGVNSQISDYRLALRLAAPPPDLEPLARHTAMTDAATAVANSSDAATDAANAPDAATAAAIKAMVASATSWARELLDSTRLPSDPDCSTFPALERPPLVPFVDVEALPSRSDFCFSDDENDTGPHISSDGD
jgi:ribonuclease HI